MQGDFTRWTFDPREGYRSVLLQQGRVLLDAEWNEQTQITAQHDEVRTRDAVGQAGGPLDGAGFDIVDISGAVPKKTAWGDLRITPGRYYVDGVLVEAAPPADGGVGHKLADQPYLRCVGDDLPGLPEPPGDGRYAVLLDCFNQHVTADQVPSLLESALGGPDTTTRARTVWQVRLVEVAAGATCADVTDPLWRDRTPPTMTAALPEVDSTADPCRLSTSGGYRRLENQLYRIQVHDVGTGGIARYLYSRENGSVVAGLTAIGSSSAAGMDAELTLSRIGRDEELSFRQGDLVEVTSPDRELHGLPGHLATAGPPDGLALPVKWAATGPADLAALGSTPIVRRWDGPAQPANSSPDELDKAGIEVRFGAGDFRTGDHWLVPARTMRLMYGISALSGTIEWPEEDNKPLALPPLGPEHHVAVLGILERGTAAGHGRWTLEESCRRLTPPLTELVTIDLLGGDGQQAPAGQPLPEPVRVVVRNGGVPVKGARVKFSATGGNVATGVPTTTDPAKDVFPTDENGQVDVRWRLPATGSDTQVLTAVRLDDAGQAVGAEVRVTGRRQEKPGDSVCLVVRPETDLVQLFAGLSGVPALELCLTSGTWELSAPAVLSGVGCVRITGAGAVITKIHSTAGSALHFVNCGEVCVRDLSVAARPAERDHRDGALTVQCAGPALVERVHASVTDAPTATATGITVRGGYRPVSRTVVRDCRVMVGHAQTGVLVIDSERTDVTGCDISAACDDVPDPWSRFLEWLRDPRFARLVARRAVHPLRTQDDGDPLGLRYGYSFVNEFPPRFGTEIDDDEGWSDYLYGSNSSTVAELQTSVRDDLMLPDVLARFSPKFVNWLGGGVYHNLGVLPVASAGITVAGSAAGEVRVRDNTVTGALAGITVALRHRDGAPRTIQHAWISGNTINPPWRAPTAFIHQAMSIGHCRRLDVTSNVVDFAGNKPVYPMQGLRCAGRLGPHAVVAGNMFHGTTNGIRVEAGPPDWPILRVARDNICTSGPALMEPAGVWVAEGNVSG
ncbi:DUF6519 domain-containing protein [Nonomuraea sp. B5E05]|uniref:DUF6519 domain-containing protein n=1 Tax=Nonomuraea sp. B5E05 TaxID=3153569 RepID=UPI003261B535